MYMASYPTLYSRASTQYTNLCILVYIGYIIFSMCLGTLYLHIPHSTESNTWIYTHHHILTYTYTHIHTHITQSHKHTLTTQANHSLTLNTHLKETHSHAHLSLTLSSVNIIKRYFFPTRIFFKLIYTFLYLTPNSLIVLFAYRFSLKHPLSSTSLLV